GSTAASRNQHRQGRIMTDHPSTPAPQLTWRRWLLGSRGVLIAGAVLFGILGGVGAFTFGYGQGASYLSNNPLACANCHVMQDHYNSWQNSSHRHVAVCNDCHLPHNFAGKWVT